MCQNDQMTQSKEEIILHAAHAVFLHYGYKRVSMNDIAEAAGISRPAVYLSFSNKETIFKEVIRKTNAHNLEEIQRGLSHHPTVKSKLFFAFDKWAIQPFEQAKHSRDANELTEAAFQHASDVLNESGLAFEALLEGVLDSAANDTIHSRLSSKKIAHLLRGAARGLKEISHDADELRHAVKDLIELVVY